jgi:hypothetical protein
MLRCTVQHNRGYGFVWGCQIVNLDIYAGSSHWSAESGLSYVLFFPSLLLFLGSIKSRNVLIIPMVSWFLKRNEIVGRNRNKKWDGNGMRVNLNASWSRWQLADGLIHAKWHCMKMTCLSCTNSVSGSWLARDGSPDP